MTLSQLRGLPGASAAEAAWAAARASQPGWLAGPGRRDRMRFDRGTDRHRARGLDRPGPPHRIYLTSQGLRPDGSSGCECTCGRCTCPARTPLSPATLARLRQTMLHLAADAMSGPGGPGLLAAHLPARGGLGASPSLPLAAPLPLDTGEAEPTIPPHLRRAVLTRHRRCCFPGCDVPATACQIHHFIPRSRGGPTALGNLGPVCAFHHLIVIHRWGWTLRLNADATVTATTPEGHILPGHGPPRRAA